jgi:MFS family permease
VRPGLREAAAALRYRQFALFWSAALVSNTGSWMQNAAVPYVLFQLTHSAAWAGLAGFAQLFPAVIMGPLAGSLADRFPRRRILLVTQSLLAVTAFGLWLLWVSGAATPVSIIVVVAIAGVIAGLNIPSWQAFVSELVPRSLLLNAVTLNSAQFNASRALGPALGGLVLAVLGPGWAFLLNALSFGAVIAALVLIGRARAADAADAVGAPVVDAAHPDGRGQSAPLFADAGNPRRRGRVRREFAETMRYVAARRGMSACVLVVAAIGFFGSPVFQLLVVFTDEVFHVGRAAYGFLGACLGIGAVLGTPLIAGPGSAMRRSKLTGTALLVYAGALVCFALAPAYLVAAVSLLVAGAAYLGLASTLNTTVQLQVDEAMRGRAISLYLMGLTASAPLGAVVQGWLAEQIGPRPTVAGAGTLLLALGVLLRVTGRLRPMDDPGPPVTAPAAAGVAPVGVPGPSRTAHAAPRA